MNHSLEPPLRIAVIGGGISGLAAAHRLIELSDVKRMPLHVTLFDAGATAGGVVGTRRIGDYLVELGADSFITNKPWGVDLCRRLGMEDRLIPTDERYRRSLVLRRGRPVAVPEGFMLLSPAKVWPVLTSPIFSPVGKLRMVLEYIVPRKIGESDESLADFVRRRFGREALDRLVQPLVGGIYTSDPEKLSVQATMPRFLDMERDYRSLIRASRLEAKRQSTAERTGSGARYGLFAAPMDGISELVETVMQRVSASATVRLKTRVTSVRRRERGKGYRLTLEEGGGGSVREGESDLTQAPSHAPLRSHSPLAEEFDAVILTIPAWQAADLIESFDVELAAGLRTIEYASSAIVVTGHRLADIAHPLDAFGLVIPAIENREVMAVSFASRKFPGRAPDGSVLLRTFVGGAMQPQLFDRSDEELIAIVRRELAEILGVTGEPDFSLVARYPRAMPQYYVGHLDRIARIEQLAGQHAGFELAGNAYHGVGLPDCIHSGEQAAEKLLAQLHRSQS